MLILTTKNTVYPKRPSLDVYTLFVPGFERKKNDNGHSETWVMYNTMMKFITKSTERSNFECIRAVIVHHFCCENAFGIAVGQLEEVTQWVGYGNALVGLGNVWLQLSVGAIGSVVALLAAADSFYDFLDTYFFTSPFVAALKAIVSLGFRKTKWRVLEGQYEMCSETYTGEIHSCQPCELDTDCRSRKCGDNGSTECSEDWECFGIGQQQCTNGFCQNRQCLNVDGKTGGYGCSCGEDKDCGPNLYCPDKPVDGADDRTCVYPLTECRECDRSRMCLGDCIDNTCTFDSKNRGNGCNCKHNWDCQDGSTCVGARYFELFGFDLFNLFTTRRGKCALTVRDAYSLVCNNF